VAAAAVGNDCDLAVLSVAEPAFAKGLKLLALGDVSARAAGC
jgi:hypothetical protein